MNDLSLTNKATLAFMAGFVGSIVALNMPYKIIIAIVWTVLYLCFALYVQLKQVNNGILSWGKSMIHLGVTMLSLSIPLWVITLGTYAGNVLRP